MVDLVGGYYDAGDNVKFNFPMAFSTTLLAWSVVEFGEFMGTDLQHAHEAIRWATDYFLKATITRGKVFALVGNPWVDHDCWERSEDMDTPRTSYAVDEKHPGSEVSAEIAAALAASSIAFKDSDPQYSAVLIQRAKMVFAFANKYQGSYNDSIGQWVCPFYCDYNGYQDELIWGAAWIFKATNLAHYWDYVKGNIHKLETLDNGGIFTEFGWDAKHAGINVLVSKFVMNSKSETESTPFVLYADKFICSVLPESPTKVVTYSPGGLLFKPGTMCNMQHPTALGLLLLVYARYSKGANRVVLCDDVEASPSRLIDVVKSQVDYILGKNPLNMSYMVGYGEKYPLKIHHRGSSLPSTAQHPDHIGCEDGTPYFLSNNPNPNLLAGALVGGPYFDDSYDDSRADSAHSEPTTYANAPFIGLLAYFKAFPSTKFSDITLLKEKA